MKKFFLFFLFLKVRYNWYNSNYCCIPTLNRSKLYLDPYISFGTIGTIEKLVLITNAYLSKSSIIVIYQRNKGRARIFLYYIFLFYKSGSIHRL